MLDMLNFEDDEYDADVLLLYDESIKPGDIASAALDITSEGESVAASAEMPANGKYRRVVRITERGLENIETVD